MIGDLFSIASKWGFSPLFRIILPGLIFSLLLLPLVNPLVPTALRIDELADLATILLPETVILGLFLSLFRNIVYRAYEGRLLWPQWLHGRLTECIDHRVGRRLAEADKLDKSSVRYKELWYWLRMFPLDDKGGPVAVRPTILGNILEGYEEYPLRRYGMDSIFYWYRLWPNLPERFVKQIDQLWAEADCLMYISFSEFVVSVVYTALAVAKRVVPWVLSHWIVAPTPVLTHLDLVPGWGAPEVWAVGCLVGGYIVYRFSIPLHRRNGEYFKAVFDLYRDSVVKLTEVSPDETEKWRKAWAYLQYMYVQCPHCEKYYYVEADKCPHCGETHEPQGEMDLPR